jgi:hypothetical protein
MAHNMLIETDCLNMSVDRGENTGYVIQAQQVWFGDSILGKDGMKKRATSFSLYQQGYDFEAFQ